MFSLDCIIDQCFACCKYVHQNCVRTTLCQTLFSILLYMCLLHAERGKCKYPLSHVTVLFKQILLPFS